MSKPMQSSLFTLSVLEYVAEHQPVRVAEVASGLDRPKSTVQRALVTLREAGWIRTDGSEWTRWVLTTRVLEVARGAANDGGLRDVTRDVLESMRSDERHSVMLAVREGTEWVAVDVIEGQGLIRVRVALGSRFPLHAGAAGKVILAFLPVCEVDELLAGELQRLTSATITAPGALRDELARIRAAGYASSASEVTVGVRGLSAPVFDRDDRAIASLSFTVPEPMSDDDAAALGARLVRDAAAVTARLRAGGGVGAPSR